MERYRLLAWVVMPNHVHVLIELIDGHPLSGIVHSWKSYTAHEINRTPGNQGKIWQREYFDRWIRNEEHNWQAVWYIHDNPVKAGLVRVQEEWPYSSASYINHA